MWMRMNGNGWMTYDRHSQWVIWHILSLPLPLPLCVCQTSSAAMPMPVCIVQFYLERQNGLAVDVYAIIELNSHLLIVSNVVEEHRAHKSTRTRDNRGIFDFRAMCSRRNERHVYFSTARRPRQRRQFRRHQTNAHAFVAGRYARRTKNGEEHSFKIIILTHYYYYYRLIKC